jgi:2-polyprenyl-6-methoxyphenol hydroxylase-like FAD-dependent oxidoreductase
MPPDLMALLRGWTLGFVPLNHIERGLSDLIDGRSAHPVRRVTGAVTVEAVTAMVQPGDVLIDCTGTKSVLRDHLLPAAADGEANTQKVRLEYALVITFLYDQAYDCNEYCKYYKNIDNAYYKFIPAVNRTCYDGHISHVTGIVNIPAEDYERMPPKFDGQRLRLNIPHVAQSMDRFIAKVRTETNGEVVGDLEIVRIPLDLYRARHATNLPWRRGAAGDHPFTRSPVFLAGDSAMGSPYFQSISLGFECAMFLAALLAQEGLPLTDLLERYERFIYQQWMRVYLRTRMIKHNKDLFESVGDTFALLEKLHIY